MTDVLHQLLSSKKATMTIAGLVVALAAKFGFAVDTNLVLGILGLFATYVLGQGVADAGKEAMKIDQAN